MEDLKKYFMIKEQLSQDFSMDQWKIISEKGSQEFLAGQQELLQKLMKSPKIYNRFFERFYANHVKLVHWFMLATRNKKEMEEYVFRPLVSHRITFYNEKIKDAMQNREKKTPEKETSRQIDIKAFQQQLMQDFFKDLLVRNQKENSHRPKNLKLFPKKNENAMDSHQMYLKTFDACNGRKYIYYDYQKHMKGIKQRFKYNAFLRTNQSNKMFNYKQEMNDLTRFQQFQQAKQRQKCSILPFNGVLRDHSLNSQKGFRKVMKTSNSQKLVFVNHLGKPVTYKLAKPFR